MNYKKLDDYHKREIKWAEISRNQLSFYIHLLLTLSIGFLSFGYDYDSLSRIYFDPKHSDTSLTLLMLSFLLIAFSIILGLIVSLTRLYDFRITRKIAQTRHRVYKYSQTYLSDSPFEKSSICDKIKAFINSLFESYPKITIVDGKYFKDGYQIEYANFKRDFNKLRKMADDLGSLTYCIIRFQTAIFIFAIFFFVVSKFALPI